MLGVDFLGNFCGNCGNKRIEDENFCRECGKSLASVELSVNEVKEEQISSIPVNETHSIKKGEIKKYIRPLMILINILFTVLAISTYSVFMRHIEWGGYYSNARNILILLIVLYIVVVFLNLKNKSWSLLIPTILSFIFFVNLAGGYSSFKEWMSYESSMMQSVLTPDLKLFLLYIWTFLLTSIINVFVLLKKRNTEAEVNVEAAISS